MLITVCNRTETAARIHAALEKKRILIEELCDPARLLHIDSKVLARAEGRVEAAAVEAAGEMLDDNGDGDEDEDGSPSPRPSPGGRGRKDNRTIRYSRQEALGRSQGRPDSRLAVPNRKHPHLVNARDI